MKKDFNIRPVKLEDAERILEIYSYYILETAITFEIEVPSLKDFEERIQNISKKFPYFVCEIPDEENPGKQKIIGYVYVHEYSEREAYNWTVETSIYVDKDERRSGCGKLLYEVLEKELSKRGIINMLAGVAFNEKEDEYLTHDSFKFHNKMGFKTVGHLEAVGKKYDRWYDILWMQKRLD